MDGADRPEHRSSCLLLPTGICSNLYLLTAQQLHAAGNRHMQVICTGVLTGLDTAQKQLMFIAGSTPDARRQVRVPLAALQDGQLSLRTDLMDTHLYIFRKSTLCKALEARPTYESIRQVKALQKKRRIKADCAIRRHRGSA